MCPQARRTGIFPPIGQDPNICPKQIFGVYDDHDFGVNNMNHRLPHKEMYKNMFLDAIGEPFNRYIFVNYSNCNVFAFKK